MTPVPEGCSDFRDTSVFLVVSFLLHRGRRLYALSVDVASQEAEYCFSRRPLMREKEGTGRGRAMNNPGCVFISSSSSWEPSSLGGHPVSLGEKGRRKPIFILPWHVLVAKMSLPGRATSERGSSWLAEHCRLTEFSPYCWGQTRAPFDQQRPHVSSFHGRALEAPSSRVSVRRPVPNRGLRTRLDLFASSQGSEPARWGTRFQSFIVDKKNGSGPDSLRLAAVVSFHFFFSPFSRCCI